MFYISCLLAMVLIVFVINRYLAGLKRKEAELIRELEMLKAKDITDELKRMELSDLVERSNLRYRTDSTPSQTQSGGRSGSKKE